MPAPVLQFKRGNAGVAGTVPALRPGEPAISLNNFDFFIGIDTSVANNKFFGSHRYWGREDGTTSLRLKFVDKDGTNSINLKAPNTLSGVGTYTLPATSTIVDGYFLKVATDGTLSWDTASGTNGTFTNPTFTGITTVSGTFFNVNTNADLSGITTFSNTTDNTLGNENTGAVQLDGGMGIAKNLTVKQNLHVGGYSEFVGVVTFRGGTINLGDGNTDDINVAGEFISNLVPNADNTYDIGDGSASKRWRNASFSGVGTFATGLVADAVRLGIDGNGTVDTTSGNLILHSATGTVEVAQHLDVIGDLDVTGNVYIGGTTVTLRGQDVIIENRDILLGYTTSVTPNDTTANHGGVAIASTEGSPLASFTATGINTFPDTYKQLMWFKSGTLGFATDAFAFNYGVAIGTTQMANGLRLKVGSGITMTDTVISATSVNATTVTATTGNFTNLTGSLTGTISTATRALTVDTTTAPSGTFYPGLFVNNTGTASTAVYVDAGISYVSNTDTLSLTGDIAINGGDATTSATTFNLINGTATNINFGGAATALNMGASTGIATINNATVTLPNATTVNVNGANPTLASSSTGTLTHFNTNITAVNEYGAATALVIGATSGIATIRNTTFSLPNATTFNINGANPTLASSSTGTLTLFNANLTSVNAFQAATNIVLAATTGVTTVRNNLQVNGTSTFTGAITGTISTATRSTLVDTTTAPSGTFYPGLFVNNTGTASTAVYVDAGISYVSNTDTLTLTGDIAVNGGDVTTSATTFNLVNGTATNVNFAGAATALVMGAATGITTISNNLTVGGDIRVNGNDIQASDGNTNITLTSNTLTTFAGDIKVNGNDIQSSSATAITLSGSDVTVAGDLQVTGNDIKSSTGAVAITLAANDVTIADDLTVQGNLYVNGSTTQVNTTALSVEDRTIELGKVDGATTSTTTWDLGVLFNYGDAGTARKSAVIWEHVDSRFKFAKILDADTDGTNANTPQLTITGAANYAAIEINALWINDCAGQSQVISCTGTTRYLENITVDAGTF